MKSRNSAQPTVTRLYPVVLIISLVLVATIVAVPFYSAQSSSLRQASSNNSSKTAALGRVSSLVSSTATINASSSSLSPVPTQFAETITIYKSDCTTPQTNFVLGETVCAVTNNVTETNRFVNWCVACPTIAHGGQGITDITTNPQSFLYTPTVAGGWKATIADPSDSSIIPAVFTVTAQTKPIATYAADCATPKTTFSLGDTVCARAIGVNGFRFGWVDPAGFIERTFPITSDPQSDSFTLPNATTDVIETITVQNVGKWRANVLTHRGSVRASTVFSVEDNAQNNADLSIYISSTEDTPTGGSQVQYIVDVSNDGPNDAAAVHFKDETFVNATFNSVSQTSGPAFTCSGTGSVDCSIANLPSGAAAQFLVTFTAGSAGATIDNEVTVESTTNDQNPGDNESQAPPLKIGTGGTPTGCVLECPNNMTLSANTTQSGQPGTFATFANAEAFGTCGTVTMSPASGSFFPVGSTVVQATSSTGSGSCSFTVTVVQTPAPTITCQGDLTASVTGDQSEATVPVDNPTFTGADNTVLVGVRSDNRPTTDPYPIGTTTIVWTAKECNDPPQCDDPNIRSASCTQHVTVTSANAPTISCPTDKTFDAGNDCQKTLTTGQIGSPTVTPNTGSFVPTVTAHRSDNLDLTDPYPAGQTVITWTAENAVGQVSCTQTITITSSGDTTPPTLTAPPDVSVTVNACSALLDDELGVATATDNCSTVAISRTGVPTVPCPIPGNPTRVCETFIFPAGTTDVTYTATDAAGNTSTAVQHVTVHELTPPTFTFVPGNLTINTGPGATSCGVVVSDATLGTAIVADNCDTTVIRTGVPAGNNFPVGTTIITYAAKADLSVTATQSVTIVDNTPPIVTAPAPVTLYTGAGATSCGVTVSNLDTTLGTGSATDNCPGVGAVTRSGVPAGNNFPVGTTTVTYSATDAAGNTGSATQVVTVIDNTVPVITTNGQTLSLWPPNHAYHTFQVTNFVTGASDNCTTLSVSDVVIEKVTSDEAENGAGSGNTLNDIVIAADCKSVQLRAERENEADGRVYTITFKVTDAAGNVGRATATVVVRRNLGEAPVDSGVHYTVNGTCP